MTVRLAVDGTGIKNGNRGGMDPREVERKAGVLQNARAGGSGRPAQTGVLPDRHERRGRGAAAEADERVAERVCGRGGAAARAGRRDRGRLRVRREGGSAAGPQPDPAGPLAARRGPRGARRGGGRRARLQIRRRPGARAQGLDEGATAWSCGATAATMPGTCCLVPKVSGRHPAGRRARELQRPGRAGPAGRCGQLHLQGSGPA